MGERYNSIPITLEGTMLQNPILKVSTILHREQTRADRDTANLFELYEFYRSVWNGIIFLVILNQAKILMKPSCGCTYLKRCSSSTANRILFYHGKYNTSQLHKPKLNSSYDMRFHVNFSSPLTIIISIHATFILSQHKTHLEPATPMIK